MQSFSEMSLRSNEELHQASKLYTGHYFVVVEHLVPLIEIEFPQVSSSTEHVHAENNVIRFDEHQKEEDHDSEKDLALFSWYASNENYDREHEIEYFDAVHKDERSAKVKRNATIG